MALLAAGCADHHPTTPTVSKEVAPRLEMPESATSLVESKPSAERSGVVVSYIGISGPTGHMPLIPQDKAESAKLSEIPAGAIVPSYVGISTAAQHFDCAYPEYDDKDDR